MFVMGSGLDTSLTLWSEDFANSLFQLAKDMAYTSRKWGCRWVEKSQWAGERRWEVFYGPVLLGLYDEDRPRKGLLRIQRQTALSPQEASSSSTKRGRPRPSSQGHTSNV